MDAGHLKLLTAGTGTAAVLGLSYISYWWHKKQPRVTQTQSIPVAKVTNLTVYPVASCSGIQVERATCTPRGIEFNGFGDRTFVIVEPNGKKVSGKEESCLVLIKPSVDESGFLTLNAPGMPPLRLDVRQRCNEASKLTVNVYGFDQVEALDMGDEASEWISHYLLKSGSKVEKVHLVHYPWTESQRRQREFKAALNELKPQYQAHFARVSSFLMVNERSVEAFNEELRGKGNSAVTVGNFRPNITVDLCPPFAEETWSRFEINGMMFNLVMPATRCIFVNVNPNGQVCPDQPYLQLRNYHTLKEDKIPKFAKQGAPVMGIFVSSDQNGIISVGDTVYAVLQ